jgi:hypothetical protein
MVDGCIPDHYLEAMDLSLHGWTSLSDSERESASKRLASNLPSGFEFDTLVGNNALFVLGATKFVLVPGGNARLGFDPERVWVPTEEEAESWRRTAHEYGLPESINEHVMAVTLRPREVDVAPFLVETSPWELGWIAIDPDDDEIKSLLKQYPNGVQLCRGDATTRVRKNKDGSIHAQRSANETQSDLIEDFRAKGFRFLTSDEWEYLCGCGERTLFRWGDHVPCDRYPTDKSVEEARYRKERVLSAGKLEPAAKEFTRDWDLHVRQNALGVFIASNPYHCELVAESGITRGGDGGCAICGGYGFFMGWLPLATAYFEEQFCKFDPTEPVSVGYIIGRRVFDLR